MLSTYREEVRIVQEVLLGPREQTQKREDERNESGYLRQGSLKVEFHRDWWIVWSMEGVVGAGGLCKCPLLETGTNQQPE
jgi:hypothetical protein